MTFAEAGLVCSLIAGRLLLRSSSAPHSSILPPPTHTQTSLCALHLQNEKKRIAIISAEVEEAEADPNAPKQLSTTEAAGALPAPGASTATAGAGTGLAEALNLAGGSGSSSSNSTGGGIASVERPAEDATDPELASWVEQLQQEVSPWCRHVLGEG